MKLSWNAFGTCFAVIMISLASLWFAGCETAPPNANPSIEVPNPPLTATNTATSDSPSAAYPAPAPTNGAPSVRLRVGDSLIITYSDAPTKMEPYAGRIKDDGSVTISPYSRTFVAAGKNVRELEKEIHDRYVPQYFRNLTVSINTETLFFTVDGEVRKPDRYVLPGQMTLLQAIATAGGFTDFAKKTKVQILRADGNKITVNYKKVLVHPRELDLQIYPGDRINVLRSIGLFGF